MSEKKLVGIGETVLDIVFKNGQPVAAVPGGSTFNSMISLGRTVGRLEKRPDVLMLSQVGSDKVAGIVTEFMEKNGVSPDGMCKVPGTQSVVSMAMLDENNDASYEFFRDSRTPEFVAPEISFNAGDVVLFGSYFAVGAMTRKGTRKLISAAREAGATIYYDVNYRANHINDIDELRPIVEENCALSTVVRASSEDLMNLYGCADAEKVYLEHIAPLCKLFIVTFGGDRTEVFAPGIHRTFDVPAIETVSTIGAGDNFNAGFIYGLLKNGGLEWDRIIPVATSFSANVCRSIYNYVDEDFLPYE